MHRTQHVSQLSSALIAPSVAYLLGLVYAGKIYASQHSEPSGMQYVMLPLVAAPLVGIAAVALVVRGRRAGLHVLTILMPFAACALLASPIVGVPLSDTYAQFGLIAVIVFGLAHVASLLLLRVAHTSTLTTDSRGRR